MRAAILKADRSIEVGEYPTPAADDAAIVRVKAAGVCGTELHFLDGLLQPDAYPFILGHEFSGVVEEVPAGETRFRKGDRVAVYNLVACGTCKQCTLGRQEICDNPSGQMGFNMDGGFAEFARVPVGNLVPIPDSLDFETAATLACSGMAAIHGVRMGEVSLGSTAVVNGIGGVGLMVVQAAQLAGADVIAVGDSDEKLDLAKALGARAVRAGNEKEYEELPDEIKRLTGGAGAEYFFELVGTTASMAAGFACLGKAGTFVSIGYTNENLVVNPVMLIIGEQRLVSCVAARKTDLEDGVRLAAAGKMKATIQGTLPVDRIGEALQGLRERRVLGRNIVTFD
jgi:D-arabinose 1-dehydrogenase-like Zn-dependent alcohol dehydrogenase